MLLHQGKERIYFSAPDAITRNSLMSSSSSPTISFMGTTPLTGILSSLLSLIIFQEKLDALCVSAVKGPIPALTAETAAQTPRRSSAKTARRRLRQSTGARTRVRAEESS